MTFLNLTAWKVKVTIEKTSWVFKPGAGARLFDVDVTAPVVFDEDAKVVVTSMEDGPEGKTAFPVRTLSTYTYTKVDGKCPGASDYVYLVVVR